MTYTEIATRFWRLHRESAFTHTETTLFLFLLNEWHIRRKRGWMDMETRFLEIAVPISRKSLVFARENLRNRGLLDYEPGIGRGSAKYTLCVSNSVSSVNTKGKKINMEFKRNNQLYKTFIILYIRVLLLRVRFSLIS